MLFEHLAGQDIREAAEKGSVAILPVGSIEIHGPHMPTGTDSLIVYGVAKLAARKADAVVLPPFYYAYVPENRHFPGTISLTAKTMLTLLEEVCDEIARNGFRKILILNGHGGNNEILRVFLRDSLAKKRKYAIYAMINPGALIRDLIEELTQGRTFGHACEVEASAGLYLFEDSIKMERIEREAKLGSTGLPQGIETPVDWQAYATELYLGDPRHATREKGKILVERFADNLANAIRTIKQEANVPRILDDFYTRAFEK